MFKVGDHVEVFQNPHGDYAYSNVGSRGVVVQLEGGGLITCEVFVGFYKQTGFDPPPGSIWPIDKHCLRKVEEPDLSEEALEKWGIYISNGDILFKNDPQGQEGGKIINETWEHLLEIESSFFKDSTFAIDKDNIDDLILALWLAKKKFCKDDSE